MDMRKPTKKHEVYLRSGRWYFSTNTDCRSLVPASPAVKATAKNKDDYEDYDDKCRVAHVALLLR
jgi:hypothetical protein